MIPAQVQLTPEQAEAIKRFAAERGVPVEAIIRESVDAFVRAEARRRALAAAGSLNGGPRDLTARHDEHAGEAFDQ